MWLTLYYIFCYFVFCYSLVLMLSYLALVLMSRRAQKQLEVELPDDETIKYMLKGSPLTPAVSIIAPAFNEEVTIIRALALNDELRTAEGHVLLCSLFTDTHAVSHRGDIDIVVVERWIGGTSANGIEGLVPNLL